MVHRANEYLFMLGNMALEVAGMVAQRGDTPCLKRLNVALFESACFSNDTCCADLDPFQPVEILAGAISSKLEYNLIICGEGSGGIYTQKVGPSLMKNKIPLIISYHT